MSHFNRITYSVLPNLQKMKVLTIFRVSVFLILINLGVDIVWSTAVFEARTEHINDNHALFRDHGIVLSQTTFYHVRFEVDIGAIYKLVSESSRTLSDLRQKARAVYELDDKYAMALLEAENSSDVNNVTAYFAAAITNNDYILRSAEQVFNRTKARIDSTVETLPALGNLAGANMYHQRFKRSPGAAHLLRYLKDGQIETSPTDDHRFQDLHIRPKREVVGWVGLAVGMAALGLAIRETVRIDYLEDKVKNVVESQNRIVDSLEILQDDGKLLNIKLDSIKAMAMANHGKASIKLMMQTYTLDQELNNFYNQLNSAVTSAQHKRLAPGLISGQALKKLFKRVIDFAKEKGQNHFLKSASDLYQIDTSFGYNENTQKLVLYVHVPMCPIGAHLELKEYVPFPIMQSLDLNETILPIVGEGRFIATMPQKRGELSQNEKFRIMTENEISQCHRLGDIRLCGGRNTLRKDIFNTCIGSMLRKDSKAISRNCNFEYSPFREYVTRLSPNQWLVMTKESLSINVNCMIGSNLKSHKVSLFGQTKLTLPENCEITLKDHVLSTDWNVEEDFQIEMNTWTGPAFEGIDFNDPFLRSAYLNLINSTLSFKKSDLQLLKVDKVVESAEVKGLLDFVSAMNPIPAITGMFGQVTGFSNVQLMVNIVLAIVILCIIIFLLQKTKICNLLSKCCCCVCQSAGATIGTMGDNLRASTASLANKIEEQMEKISISKEKIAETQKKARRLFKWRKNDHQEGNRTNGMAMGLEPGADVSKVNTIPLSTDSAGASSLALPIFKPNIPPDGFYDRVMKTSSQVGDGETYTVPPTERNYPHLGGPDYTSPQFRAQTPINGLRFGPDRFLDDDQLSFDTEKSQTLSRKSLKSALSTTSLFRDPSAVSPVKFEMAPRMVRKEKCLIKNVTEKGLRRSDFECTLHDPIEGCHGTFRK